MKESGFDIVKEASRQPIQFSKILSCSCAVGRVAEVTLIRDCVRVTSVSTNQRSIILHMTERNGKVVSGH